MRSRILKQFGCWLVLAVFNAAVSADVLINEDFESYATDAQFLSAWPSNSGDPDEFGLIVPCLTAACPPSPYDGLANAGTTPPIPAAQGQAIVMNDLSYIHERTADDNGSPLALFPTTSESIRVQGDIFDGVAGNRRFSLGLRGQGANLLELGFYNGLTYDPTDPNNAPPNQPVADQPTTGYAYRLVLWDEIGGDLVIEPNWQYFPLDPAFDDPDVDHNGDGRLGNDDGLVTAVDVGPGWHTYTATISDTTVLLELDLFRDGSVDSTVTWEMTAQQGAGFSSLRFGGPSGISMNELTMIDNISLETITGGTISGDFDNNGAYECADVDALVAAIATVKAGGAADLNYDLDQDGNVADSDLDAWLAEAGDVGGLTSNGNPLLYGDASLNGVVDGADFLIWNGAKFTANPSWCNGDFNADGVVDGPDFLIWNSNKFTASSPASVPEPAGSVLLLTTLCLIRRIRR